jgi:SPP1 family predicted phage head-tail adaptor
MRFSHLTKKIDIMQVTEAQNTYGEPVKTWTNFAINRWADVDPLSGSEYLQAQQTAARVDYRFRTRYVTGITPKMRVVYNGENYDIESVINLPENEGCL